MNMKEFRFNESPESFPSGAGPKSRRGSGTISLQQWLADKNPAFFERLDLAENISDALLNLHRTGQFLNRIFPEMIFVRPCESSAQKSVKIIIIPESLPLTDSTDLGSPFPNRYSDEILPYLAPESTGRMKALPDVRSAYYSLGAILYELFTGSVPFASQTQMEIIHGHIAKKPPGPTALNEEIPEMVSRIVLKLLEKKPEARYRNIVTVLDDIRRCKEELETDGKITPFLLAQNEMPEQLSFPETLFGRDSELLRLLGILGRIEKNGPEAILITGEPGMGKTALAETLIQHAKQKSAFIISGKYDPIKKHVPFGALKNCFHEAMRQLLTEPVDRLNHWRKKLKAGIGKNGKIIESICPEIVHIIGIQPPLQGLTPHETHHRFRQACIEFLKILAERETPTILFLDDLQWADEASLSFLKHFFSTEPPEHLLFIGTCRDSEEDGIPWATILPKEWKDCGMLTTRITLAPLSRPDISNLIRRTLVHPADPEIRWAGHIFDKTAGNPLLVKRYIESLTDTGRLKFDYQKRGWHFDTPETDGEPHLPLSVTMLRQRYAGLPDTAASMLITGACLGNRFSAYELSQIFGLQPASVAETLKTAIRQRLIIQVETDPFEVDALSYEFPHDKIRQSLYNMGSIEKRQQHHLETGRWLLSQNRYASGINAVSHFNIARQLITDRKERLAIARLNLDAADNAKQSAALTETLNFCHHALAFMPDSPWKNAYQEALRLFLVKAEATYLKGDVAEAEAIMTTAFSKAETGVDKARVINLRIALYTADGRLEEAFFMGRKGLELFDRVLRLNPGKKTTVINYLKVRVALWGRSAASLAKKNELSDPEKKALLSLYTNLGVPAYYMGPDVFSQIVSQGILLALRYGLPGSFPHALVSFGLIAGAGFGHSKAGMRIALTGLKLSDTLSWSTLRARVYFNFGFFFVGWHRGVSESLYYLEIAKRSALESGDYIFAGHSINAIFMTQLISGKNIDTIFPDFLKHKSFMSRLNDPYISGNYLDNIKITEILKGNSDSLDTAFNDQREAEIRGQKNPMALFMYLNNMLKFCYLFGKTEKYISIIRALDSVKQIPAGSLYLVENCFFETLAYTAAISGEPPSEKRNYYKKIKANCRKMKRWARENPSGFYHKYLMIKAELCLINGKNKTALSYYNRAIKSAEKNGYIQNAAISAKRASDCLLLSGHSISARAYLEESIRYYTSWGAEGPALFLRQAGAELLNRGRISETDSIPCRFDQISVARATRMISTEIDLTTLIEKILLIAMENAGAHRGIYISVENARLVTEAEADHDDKEQVYGSGVTKRNDRLTENRNDLLVEAVYYVWRTGDPVVLHDAVREGDYTSTAYVRRAKPVSVLVVPIQKASMMTGILYLENRRVQGVFTDHRLKTLEMIGYQAAISVENARLYEEVRQTKERLQALSSELCLTEERERRKIAVGLHDQVGHALTSALMMLPAIKGSSDEQNRNRHLVTLKDTIKKLMDDIQTLTFELSPPVLYDLGLMAALEWLAENTIQSHNLSVRITGELTSEPDEAVSVIIFQITREVLFNCVKHARATDVSITIGILGHNAEITITDNGCGFEYNETVFNAAERGFGLFSARQRVIYMSGDFTIKSAPGKGTRVWFALPVSGQGEQKRLKTG